MEAPAGRRQVLAAGEIAEAYRITRSFVTRLTLLAPDVVEAILDGRQPPEMRR